MFNLITNLTALYAFEAPFSEHPKRGEFLKASGGRGPFLQNLSLPFSEAVEELERRAGASPTSQSVSVAAEGLLQVTNTPTSSLCLLLFPNHPWVSPVSSQSDFSSLLKRRAKRVYLISHFLPVVTA